MIAGGAIAVIWLQNEYIRYKIIITFYFYPHARILLYDNYIGVCPRFPPSQMEWCNYIYIYLYTHIYLFIYLLHCLFFWLTVLFLCTDAMYIK